MKRQIRWVVCGWIGASGCSLTLGGSGAEQLDAAAAPEVEAGPEQADAGTPPDEHPADAARPQLDAAMDPGDDDAPPEQDAAAFVPPDAALPPPLCGDAPTVVVCYPLDGDGQDHGPRANHLTVSDVAWELTGGVRLGENSGLSRAHREELSHGNTTMLAWVRVDEMPTTGRAGLIDHDGQYGLFLHPGGELRCALGIAGAGSAIAGSALQQGVWHHVACVAEGENGYLYVDGALVAMVPGSTTRTPGASALHLGENSPTGNDQLVGALDDVRILEEEWTLEQVAEDAARGR